MARLVLLVLSAAIVTSPASAQSTSQPASPWHVTHEPEPATGFNLSPSATDPRTRAKYGSQLYAGTELMPNGLVGVGSFGEKADRPADMRATARDFTIPRQPKAAVGFSLKF